MSLHPPRDVESHVHRIGRTGRAGDTDGRAFTLVDASTPGKFLSDLVQNLRGAAQHVSGALLKLTARRGGGKGGGGGGGGGGARSKVGGLGIGFSGGGGGDDELTRSYDARKTAEAAEASGSIPPPPPPAPPLAPPPAPAPVRGFAPASHGALQPGAAAILAPKVGCNAAAAAPPPPPPLAAAARHETPGERAAAAYRASLEAQRRQQHGGARSRDAPHREEQSFDYRGGARPTPDRTSYNACPPPASLNAHALGASFIALSTRPPPGSASGVPSMGAGAGGDTAATNADFAAAAKRAAEAVAARINAQLAAAAPPPPPPPR